jgi:hypothetical protein
MYAEQYGMRVVGATSTSSPESVNWNPVTRVRFNASCLRSNVVARMRVAGLLRPREPRRSPAFMRTFLPASTLPRGCP